MWWVCTVFETHSKFKSREEANIDDLIWKAYNTNIELSVKYKLRKEMHDFDDAAKFYIVKYHEEFLWDVQRSDFAEGQKGRLEERKELIARTEKNCWSYFQTFNRMDCTVG